MKNFLVTYMGSPDRAGRDEVDDASVQAGMKAWSEWATRNATSIVDQGAPVGKTKRVGTDGISDIRNRVAAYAIVRAESHAAAAKLFEGHAHFTIFPGDSVEVMECLPMPTME